MVRIVALVVSCLIAPTLSAAQSVARISVWPDGSALPLVGFYRPFIDPNGRFVVLAGPDVWLKDLTTGAAERLSIMPSLTAESLSADGTYLIVAANGDSLPAGTPRLHLLNLGSRAMTPVIPPAEISAQPTISASIAADLQSVVYATRQGLFLHDRAGGTLTRILEEPIFGSVSLSHDGRRILFRRPVPNDGLSVHDRRSGSLERADVAPPDVEGRFSFVSARISGNGRFAVFDALCVVDCGDGPVRRRIFVRDLEWRRTWEVTDLVNLPRSQARMLRAISGDGRFILVASGTSLFVIDGITRRTIRINGDQQGSDLSGAMSADGLQVVFGNPPLLPRAPFPIGPMPPIFLSSLDLDRDGMQDDWESLVGLSPANPLDAAQDADFDGLSNLDEFRLGSQPRARFQLRTREANVDPERARIVLRNRGDTPASVWLRLVDAAGLSSGYPLTVAPHSTLLLPVTEIPDRPREPFLLYLTTDVVIYPSLSQ